MMNSGSKPKTYTTCGFQGDVGFRRVAAVPAGYAPAKPDVTNDAGKPAHAVAHSETGHHHVVDASDVIRYEGSDPMVAYLVLDKDVANITHMRSFDTHGTVSLVGGAGAVWEVRRQREWDGAAERRAQD